MEEQLLEKFMKTIKGLVAVFLFKGNREVC